MSSVVASGPGTDTARIRQSLSWVDPETLRTALMPDSSSRTVIIDPAGDTALALLIQGEGRVVTIEPSPAQCALIELKRAAVRTLTHPELLRFTGAAAGADRNALYLRARAELPDDARAYWDAQPQLIARGIMDAGMLEAATRSFRTRVLPMLHSARTVRAVFERRSRLNREKFWHDRWNTFRWRTLVRLLQSGTLTQHLDEAQAELCANLTSRAFHTFVELDPSSNPYLYYVLLGRSMGVDTGLPWLAEENVELLRSRLDRLELRAVELREWLETAEADSCTGFFLADALDGLDDEQHDSAYRALVRAAAPGALLLYSTTRTTRTAPQDLCDSASISADRHLAQRLRDADRSLLAQQLHVERVRDYR